MKEGILGVHLMKVSVKRGGNVQDNPECSHLGDRHKCLIVIYSFNLTITLSYRHVFNLSMEPSERKCLVNPFTTDGFLGWRELNNRPGTISLKGFQFRIHSRNLEGVGFSLSVVCGSLDSKSLERNALCWSMKLL